MKPGINRDLPARSGRASTLEHVLIDNTIRSNFKKQMLFDFDLAPAAIIDFLGLQAGEFDRADQEPQSPIAKLSRAELQQVTPIHVRHIVDQGPPRARDG